MTPLAYALTVIGAVRVAAVIVNIIVRLDTPHSTGKGETR